MKLHIQLFRSLQVQRGTDPLPALNPGPKRLLLICLALRLGQACSREELIKRAWEGAQYQPQDPRGNLRHTLRNLSATLEKEGGVQAGFLRIEGEEVSLNAAYVVTDVQGFMVACQAAERADADLEKEQRLTEATRLYAGDLLPGDEAPWIVDQRIHLAEQNRYVLDRLVTIRLGMDMLDPAIQAAHELRDSFPPSDESLRPRRAEAERRCSDLNDKLRSRKLQESEGRPPDGRDRAQAMTVGSALPTAPASVVAGKGVATGLRGEYWRARRFLFIALLFLVLAGMLGGLIRRSIRNNERNRLDQRNRLYQAGRAHWNERTEEGLHQSQSDFTRLTALDPEYAPGHAGLADADSLLGYYGWVQPGDAFPHALTEAQNATKFARDEHEKAEAYTSLAWAEMLLWQWNQSGTDFQQARSFDSHYPTAWQWHSLYLMVRGDKYQSLTEIGRAEGNDPSAVIRKSAAQRFYYAGEYDKAISDCQDTLRDFPNDRLSRLWLGLAWEQKGDGTQSVFWLRQADELSGRRDTNMRAGLAHALAGFGDALASRRILLEMLRLRREGQTYVSPVDLAIVYTGLYDRDRNAAESVYALLDREQALAWLEQGYREHAGQMILLGVEPRFRTLHTAPRFTVLLQKMLLPSPQQTPVAPDNR